MPFTLRPCCLFPVRRKPIEHSDINHSHLLSPGRVLAPFLMAGCLFFPAFQAQVLGASMILTDCDTPIEFQRTWVDNSGQPKTDADLRSILKQHQTWLDTGKKEGKQANLSGAKLKNVNLQQVNLSEVDLANSDLSHSNLTGPVLNNSILRKATMECTRLVGVSLQGADFTETDLSRTIISDVSFNSGVLFRASFKGAALIGVHFVGAKMAEANLSSADLTNAEFVGADLRGASLRNARLVGTNLGSASLEGADLFGATYEVSNSPAPKAIAFARNIEYMTHSGDSSSLADLRGKFKETGFRDQERKITFALKSRQAELLWDSCENSKGNCFEYLVNRYLFDITSQYGMNPGRVLIIILVIFGVSTMLYLALIHFSNDSGLSIVVPAQRARINEPLWLFADLRREGEAIHEIGQVTKTSYAVQPRELHQFEKGAYYREWIRRESALLRVSFVFSLMSTFNIKFRDVDFGRWLRQLTTKEYDIKATGWARTVSGTQALLSVYFIAVLLVTYFGRPFE